MPAKFKYPVWNPSRTLDVAKDWGENIFSTTDNFDQAQAVPFSIAAIPALCTIPTMWCYDPNISPEKIRKFSLVIVTDPETYQLRYIRQWLSDIGVENYLLVLGSIMDDDMIPHAGREIYSPYYVKKLLDSNNFQDTKAIGKPFKFDVLLGSRRAHRDYVMLAMTKTGLIDQSVITYRYNWPGGQITQISQEAQECFPDVQLNYPYVSPNLNPQWEVSEHIDNTCSFQIPWKIYQHCDYSVICESLDQGSFFLSEKTMKAMFAKRVFVMFGPPGYLHRLKQHGFRTFEHIIDESYDNDSRSCFRWKKAMQQVMNLAWFENPRTIYDSVADVLEHNHKRLFSLVEERKQRLEQMLLDAIPHENFLF